MGMCSDCLICACSFGNCLTGMYEDNFQKMTNEEMEKVLKSGYIGADKTNRKLKDEEIKRLKILLYGLNWKEENNVY